MFIGAIPVIGAIVAAVLAATVFATSRAPYKAKRKDWQRLADFAVKLENAMGRVKFERTRGTRRDLDLALKKLNRAIALTPDGEGFEAADYARFAEKYMRPALAEHDAGVALWAKMKTRGVKTVAELHETSRAPEGISSIHDAERK